MLRVGVDQSKRSTAIVCTDKEGNLIDFLLSSPPLPMDNEELLVYITNDFTTLVNKWQLDRGISKVTLEGLSFGSVSSSKDLLAGLLWTLRLTLYKDYPNIPYSVVPVTRWRSKVLPIETRREITKQKTKNGLKQAVVDVLPYTVKVRFEDYMRNNKLKREAIFDLADAYWLSRFAP